MADDVSDQAPSSRRRILGPHRARLAEPPHTRFEAGVIILIMPGFSAECAVVAASNRDAHGNLVAYLLIEQLEPTRQIALVEPPRLLGQEIDRGTMRGFARLQAAAGRMPPLAVRHRQGGIGFIR